MTSIKLFGAALVLSTAFATPVFAQLGIPELPGNYAFLYPEGDLRIGAEGPGDAITVQPARVVGGLRLHPHRVHHRAH
jgi:hypothetical protein